MPFDVRAPRLERAPRLDEREDVRGSAPVLFALMLATALIHGAQHVLTQAANVHLLYSAGAIPYEVVNFIDVVDGALHPAAFLPLPLTLFSAMFVHAGLWHLFGNLWFLWLFGRRIEGRLGAWWFLGFYLLSGAAAVAFQAAMTPSSRTPIVGASGAVAAILGATLRLEPKARVRAMLVLPYLIEVVSLPSYAALATWLAWQVLVVRQNPQVAMWAHLGGFLLGGLLATLFALRRPNTSLADRLLIPSRSKS